ncbi:MAG: hypothetical protein IT173_11345 [Acidobacteria bacterium]|nr:hypothetical protein [Acidobacteriota bacterium]
MEDTNREMRAMQQKFWMSLTEEERLRRCGRLFSLAKIAADERAPKDLKGEDRKRFIFKELYGFDRPY